MILAYNTNGFSHHALVDAIDVLALVGYRGVAITLDHAALNPLDERTPDQVALVRERLARYRMTPVVETGARYLLNAGQKHEPTLVSPSAAERSVRVEFYKRAIDTAGQLGAACVSIWSGVVRDSVDAQTAYDRLAAGLVDVVRYASDAGVTVAFEPEPGMLVDTLEAYARLLDRLDDADAAALRLTVDIGHLHCNGEVPIAAQLRTWSDQIANVHIEDMRAGVHEHLQFGAGEIDFPPVLAAFEEIGYEGLLTVELSRHSHMAPEAARRAFDFLTGLINA